MKYKSVKEWFAEKEIMLHIHISDKNKFHIKNFPEYIDVIVKEAEKLRYGFPTISEFYDHLKLVKHLYEERITKKEKVIMIKIQIGEELLLDMSNIKHDGSNWEGTFLDGLEKFESTFFKKIEGYGLSIYYEIGFEYTQGEKKHKNYTRLFYNDNQDKYEERSMSLGKDFIIIPHSEKRENAIKYLKIKLEELAKQFIKLFYDPIELIKQIDSGKSKLLQLEFDGGH